MISPAGKDALKTGGLAALGTFLGLEVFDFGLNALRKKHGLPELPRDETLEGAKVGGTLTLTGLIAPTVHAPLVAGVGAAITARSVRSMASAFAKTKEATVDVAGVVEDGEGRPTATVHEVPNWPWRAKYEKVAEIFQQMMNEDQVDAAGRPVLAARWNPEVVRYARAILAESGADGKDPVAVTRAVWDHFRENYTPKYVLDPRRGDSDYFIAPHLFLRSAEDGGYGLVGDCDDAAMSIAAVLMSLGVPSVLVMVKQSRDKDYYNHIFPAAILPESAYGKEVPNDPAYRVTLPSGQKGVLIPLEHTVARPWMYMPVAIKRGVVHFDNSF